MLRLDSFSYGLVNINNYFFGNGYGTYSYISKQNVIDTNTMSNTILNNTFNQYFQLFIDLGFVGIILFFMMFYKITKLKTLRFSYLKVWIITFLIFNQSGVWLLPSSYSWLLISIGLGILVYEHRKIQKNTLNCKEKIFC